MNTTLFFWGIALIAHIILAIKAQLNIRKTNLLSSTQKRINILLIWLIPIVWSLVIMEVLKPPKVRVMTKGKRKRKTGSPTDNWMHLTGNGHVGHF